MDIKIRVLFALLSLTDICPEEIEKAVKVVDAIDGNEKIGRVMINIDLIIATRKISWRREKLSTLYVPFQKLIPVFITIDPERDTADIVKSYIAEFSPKMVGYVGSPEEVKEASRKFRVYFRLVRKWTGIPRLCGKQVK